MLFERLVVHTDREPGSAAMNMALDEALLEQSSLPVLRFYGWRGPSLSFGYFGKFAELAQGAGTRELVRRWTGGGSVLHGEDLTYSLVTRAVDSGATQGPLRAYAILHRAIRDALVAEGKPAELAGAGAPRKSEACFANPVRDDVMLRGHKVAGGAQRRTRGGFLHQGSIQVPDLSEEFRGHFARALALRIELREIPREVLRRAAVLAAEKYATDEWLRRW